MSTLTKIDLSILLDAYLPLLTEKQKDMLTSYCHYDCSLAEIAEEHGVSRQAVLACIKSAENTMLDIESKLNLVASMANQKQMLNEVKTFLANGDNASATTMIDKLLNEDE